MNKKAQRKKALLEGLLLLLITNIMKTATVFCKL